MEKDVASEHPVQLGGIGQLALRIIDSSTATQPGSPSRENIEQGQERDFRLSSRIIQCKEGKYFHLLFFLSFSIIFFFSPLAYRLRLFDWFLDHAPILDGFQN